LHTSLEWIESSLVILLLMGSFWQFFGAWKSSHNGAYKWVLSLLRVLFFFGLDFFSLYDFYRFLGICINSSGWTLPFRWLTRPRWFLRWTFIFLSILTRVVIFGKPYKFPHFDELLNSIFQVKAIVSVVFGRFVKPAEFWHVCPYANFDMRWICDTCASWNSAFAHLW
jgi:hypothetical protein